MLILGKGRRNKKKNENINRDLGPRFSEIMELLFNIITLNSNIINTWINFNEIGAVEKVFHNQPLVYSLMYVRQIAESNLLAVFDFVNEK